jgi:hypothetical protein
VVGPTVFFDGVRYPIHTTFFPSFNKLTSLLVGDHHSPNPSTKEVIPLFSSFQTKLAGVTFGNCQESIRKWGHQDIRYFSLEREPDNPHDPMPSVSGFS